MKGKASSWFIQPSAIVEISALLGNNGVVFSRDLDLIVKSLA
jgi:hypothetical protein